MALRLIAFVTAIEPVSPVLAHVGEPAEPRASPARRALLAPLPDWDALGQPAPESAFDQRGSW